MKLDENNEARKQFPCKSTQIENMKQLLAKLILVLTTVVTLGGCHHNPPTASPCIRLPRSSNTVEKEASLKISADLVASIGKPSLETSYKSKVNEAFASIGQKSLEQLVLIEFLVCIKQHHSKAVSPETLAAMDRALTAAVLRAAGARGLGGKLTAESRRRLNATTYGAQKLGALDELHP
jgi:hypothetical protein